MLTMPESMSLERRAMLKALGAQLVLTPAEKGMKGAIEKANELVQQTPGSWMPQQFENPANPAIHEATTGPEIWEDSGHKIDAIVAGVGTGGTITGVTRFIRKKNPDFKAFAVEPADSPGDQRRQAGPAQDPGHRRRLRSEEPRHIAVERRDHGHQRRGLRVGPPAGPRGRRSSRASAPARTSARSPRPSSSSAFRASASSPSPAASAGGGGEIRTHGAHKSTPVFKTGALNHSATPPYESGK